MDPTEMSKLDYNIITNELNCGVKNLQQEIQLKRKQKNIKDIVKLARKVKNIEKVGCIFIGAFS